MRALGEGTIKHSNETSRNKGEKKIEWNWNDRSEVVRNRNDNEEIHGSYIQWREKGFFFIVVMISKDFYYKEPHQPYIEDRRWKYTLFTN